MSRFCVPEKCRSVAHDDGGDAQKRRVVLSLESVVSMPLKFAQTLYFHKQIVWGVQMCGWKAIGRIVVALASTRDGH